VDPLPSRVATETTKFLQAMGIPGAVVCRERFEDSPCLWVEILAEESRVLIGERGSTLHALEHVLRLVLRPIVGELRVVADVNAYRARREELLRRTARTAARRVRRFRHAVVLEPMHAADRRIVHVTLAGEEGVKTESRGEDPQRRVIIRPSDPLV
jgi:spoIIIJ-associated protein